MIDTANELRKCLRFDEPTPEESRLEQLARKAADELDTLRELVRAAESTMLRYGSSETWNVRAEKALEGE
jgi:hypothetical protein